MRSRETRIAAIIGLGLLAGGCAAEASDRPAAIFQGFLQPFLVTFDRHEEHVIVFLLDHPEYEAIEAMVDRRAGGPPRIRATLNLRDGIQIDHFNDPDLARDRAAIFTGRQTVLSPITFESGEVGGAPAVRIHFTSYRGEDIALDFQARSRPTPELGGFINPGAHAGGSSLPVMWAGESAHEGEASALRIDGIPFALGNGPPPAFPGGIYSSDFRIGVVREGQLELRPLDAPGRLEAGEQWLYQDSLGHLHAYEILAARGDGLTIRKTTTSPALAEEILEAEVVEEAVELRSVRAPGGFSSESLAAPALAGFVLDLSAPGGFSLSLDEHARLVTGEASRESTDATTRWILEPRDPSWTTSRRVSAVVRQQQAGYVIETEVGEARPGAPE